MTFGLDTKIIFLYPICMNVFKKTVGNTLNFAQFCFVYVIKTSIDSITKNSVAPYLFDCSVLKIIDLKLLRRSFYILPFSHCTCAQHISSRSRTKCLHMRILIKLIRFKWKLPFFRVPTLTVNWISVNDMSIGLFLGRCMSTIRVTDVISIRVS